jgi:hypothetical protein
VVFRVFLKVSGSSHTRHNGGFRRFASNGRQKKNSASALPWGAFTKTV